MAYERNPNDPSRSNPADDPYRVNRDSARADNELQADPELAEGPASGGRIAMFAVAIAVVLGAVFYGLNNSSIDKAGTSSTAQNTTQSSPPRGNTGPGTTTGSAPAQPAPAPGGTGNPAPK
jgi:hypothetical protein